jgi:hypothetical protein
MITINKKAVEAITDNRLTPQALRYYLRYCLIGQSTVNHNRREQKKLINRDTRGIREAEMELEKYGYITVEWQTAYGNQCQCCNKYITIKD